MKNSILLGIGFAALAGVLAFSFVPASLSAECIITFSPVPAEESPETDENGNGTICKYVRPNPSGTDMVFYQDD